MAETVSITVHAGTDIYSGDVDTGAGARLIAEQLAALIGLPETGTYCLVPRVSLDLRIDSTFELLVIDSQANQMKPLMRDSYDLRPYDARRLKIGFSGTALSDLEAMALSYGFDSPAEVVREALKSFKTAKMGEAPD